MKAICHTQYPALIGIFDIGDKVEITPIVSKYDYHKSCPIKPENTIPAGNYQGFKIVSKNGGTYNENDIINKLGYKTLSEIFGRIEN